MVSSCSRETFTSVSACIISEPQTGAIYRCLFGFAFYQQFALTEKYLPAREEFSFRPAPDWRILFSGAVFLGQGHGKSTPPFSSGFTDLLVCYRLSIFQVGADIATHVDI